MELRRSNFIFFLYFLWCAEINIKKILYLMLSESLYNNQMDNYCQVINDFYANKYPSATKYFQ